MKAHKYWSLGALAAMFGIFYTGYKNMKSAHKYFACSSLFCMIIAIYSGHEMISGKSKKRLCFRWRIASRTCEKETSTVLQML